MSEKLSTERIVFWGALRKPLINHVLSLENVLQMPRPMTAYAWIDISTEICLDLRNRKLFSQLSHLFMYLSQGNQLYSLLIHFHLFSIPSFNNSYTFLR